MLLIAAETIARDTMTHDSSHETSVTVSLQWAAVTSAHLWPAEEQVAVLYSTVLCCGNGTKHAAVHGTIRVRP